MNMTMNKTLPTQEPDGTMGETMNKAQSTREATKRKDEGAGRNDNVYEGGGAGLSAKMKDKGKGRNEVVRRIKGGGRRAMRWVRVNLGGKEMNLCCKTGSNTTIITPEMYRESMGKVVAARSYLRSTGSTEYLDTKGMFKTTLTSASGATKRTWV
jgi:hypothetical protein